MEASYPRANNPSVTIFLQKLSLRLQILFFSTIFAVSASKLLSRTLAHATKPCQKRKITCFRFQKRPLLRTLSITQPAWTIVYLESFAGLAGGEIGVAERVRVFVRAVVVVPVEAVTSVAVVWSGVLLVTLLDETLHHFRQTRRARLEIIGAVKRFIASGNLFRRRISENARELALEEPLQSWLHNRLG